MMEYAEKHILPAPVSDESRHEAGVVDDSLLILERYSVKGDIDSLKAVDDIYKRRRYQRLINQMDDDET